MHDEASVGAVAKSDLAMHSSEALEENVRGLKLYVHHNERLPQSQGGCAFQITVRSGYLVSGHAIAIDKINMDRSSHVSKAFDYREGAARTTKTRDDISSIERCRFSMADYSSALAEVHMRCRVCRVQTSRQLANERPLSMAIFKHGRIVVDVIVRS